VYVEVAANLGANNASTYTYYVPEQLHTVSLLGKRVLVELKNRKLEAFVIKETDTIDPDLTIRPILAVLDSEPVIDRQLLELAAWMAEYYVESIGRVINIMLPPLLKKTSSPQIKPLLSQAEWAQLDMPILKEDEKIRSFFDRLWEKGALSRHEALAIINAEQLKNLEKNGLIFYVSSYERKAGGENQKLVINPERFNWEKDYNSLKKRAPQQAAILELLKKEALTKKELNQHFSSSSINSLLKKGFITWYKDVPRLTSPDYSLNAEQMNALLALKAMLKKNEFAECLLWGVTGSGKTEVYVRAVEECLRQGKNALILVPEIALARQMISIFSTRFANLALLHSSLTPKERYLQWQKIRQGQARVVLGARSAVFAPLPSIGLIIIDEEQEVTYKQEESPRYHCREVARQRAVMSGAVLLLGSATPSIETFHAALEGRIKMLTLKQRTAGARMPLVCIDNLKRSKTLSAIGDLLASKIEQRLKDGEQVILFINRRGYSPRIICKSCGAIMQCPNCSVAMVYHLDVKQNICHYCNYSAPLANSCSVCGQNSLAIMGAGTQKIEAEIKALFPSARVGRLDTDMSQKRDYQQQIINKMLHNEMDILIGTQMVAKGFDFPEVSLVGIIDADSLLSLPDFRAGERGFQLIVQAAGRAGRAEKPGEVVIQTYNPDNPVINLAAEQNYFQYALEEIKMRKLLKYPPFVEILRIVVSSEKEEKARECALDLTGLVNDLTDASEEDFQVLGFAPCPINRIKKRFRFHIMIKACNRFFLNSLARHIKRQAIPKEVRLEIDFNPVISM